MSGGVAPASLRSAMARALERLPAVDERSPARLARAGLSALEAAIAGQASRSSAGDLLAADALLTSACQAAAEASPETLEALLATLTLERFEVLLEAGAA